MIVGVGTVTLSEMSDFWGSVVRGVERQVRTRLSTCSVERSTAACPVAMPKTLRANDVCGHESHFYASANVYNRQRYDSRAP